MEKTFSIFTRFVMCMLVACTCWSCSSSDEPDPKDATPQDEKHITMQEFTAKVVGNTWEFDNKNAENDWTTCFSDGTTAPWPEHALVGGHGDFFQAISFTPEKCVFFYHPDYPADDYVPNARVDGEYSYNPETGMVTISPRHNKQMYVESVTDETLVLRGEFGNFAKTPEEGRDPGSYNRYVYHRVSADRLKELLSTYVEK